MTAPWLPPRVPGFGPWIEIGCDEKRPSDIKRLTIARLWKSQRWRKEWVQSENVFSGYGSARICRGIVAYCVEEV